MALIVAPSMLVAQESLPEAYTSPDERLMLRYPAGWAVQTDEGFTIIATSEQGFAFSGDAVMAIVFSDSAGLQEELASTEEIGVFTVPSTYYLAGRSAARSESSVAGNDVVIIAMSMGSDVFRLVIGVTAPGELAKFEPKIAAIIESINYLPQTPDVDLNALQTITPD